MLSLGSCGEILIIALAALILIGPKEAPVVIRACGRWLFRLRQFSRQIHQGINHLMEESELEAYEKSARAQAEMDISSIQTQPPCDLSDPDSGCRSSMKSQQKSDYEVT